MARRPQVPAVPRAAWVALALSVLVHGLFLAALAFLPEGAHQADGPVSVSTVVLLSNDPAAPTVTAPETTAPAETPGPEPDHLVTPTILPDTPVPIVPASPPEPATGPPGAAEAPRSEGNAGGRPGLTFFQVAAEGQSVVYVIDRSASMGLGDGLAAARAELLASLRQLPASARFQVVCYSRDADVLRIAGRSDLVPATPDNVRETAQLLDHARAGGSTNHVQALRRALALEPDVIFLVTDAADLSPEQVAQVTRWNGGRTAIHAIELGGPDGGSALEALARSNRGTYRSISLTAN
jgi:hypothetical protein